MSSRFKNVNAASRLVSLRGLRGGRGADDFCFGLGPKSKLGRKDSGAGAVIGCGRDRLDMITNKYRRKRGSSRG